MHQQSTADVTCLQQSGSQPFGRKTLSQREALSRPPIAKTNHSLRLFLRVTAKPPTRSSTTSVSARTAVTFRLTKVSIANHMSAPRKKPERNTAGWSTTSLCCLDTASTITVGNHSSRVSAIPTTRLPTSGPTSCQVWCFCCSSLRVGYANQAFCSLGRSPCRERLRRIKRILV